MLCGHGLIATVLVTQDRRSFEFDRILLMIFNVPITAGPFHSLFSLVQFMDPDLIERVLGLVLGLLADMRRSNCREFAVVIKNSEFSRLWDKVIAFAGFIEDNLSHTIG
jgi:hypothetical protein